MGQYFIKEGYQSNEQPLTFEGNEAGSYWTSNRRKMAANYQYYVYKRCSRLLRSRGYDNLLDVGCGLPIKVKQHLYPYCRDITLVDQPSVAELAQQVLPHCEFLPANLEDIDFELAKKFDLIICADVLEHLLNPDNCLDFIRRHLRPHGLAVFSTPERDYLRGKDCNHSPKPEHIREWNSTEFAQYITSHSFKVLEHFLTPQRRLNLFEFWGSLLLSRFVRTQRWSSCQIIICRLLA